MLHTQTLVDSFVARARVCVCVFEAGYNDIVFSHNSSIAPYVLWYQLIHSR
jgi:hypothetical protein